MLISKRHLVRDVQNVANTSGGYGAAWITTTSSSYVNANVSVTFASECMPGDVLIIQSSMLITADSGSEGALQWRVSDGATDVDLTETERRTGTAAAVVPYDMCTRYTLSTVPINGSVVVNLRVKRVSGAGNVNLLVPITLVAMLLEYRG